MTGDGEFTVPGLTKICLLTQTGWLPSIITGQTDPKMICTSHVERNNLTMTIFSPKAYLGIFQKA
jgi:hypothetical protein